MIKQKIIVSFYDIDSHLLPVTDKLIFHDIMNIQSDDDTILDIRNQNFYNVCYCGLEVLKPMYNLLVVESILKDKHTYIFFCDINNFDSNWFIENVMSKRGKRKIPRTKHEYFLKSDI